MQIEVLQPGEQWPKVKKLLSDVQMTSKIPLVMARTGELEQSYPSLGGKNVFLTAQENGETIGFMRGLLHERLIRGERKRLLYVGDVRVAGHYKGRGVAGRLSQAMMDFAFQMGIYHGYFLVNSGNNPVARVLQKIPGLSIHQSTTHRTASFLLIRRPSGLPAGPLFMRIEPNESAFNDLLQSLSGCFLAPACDAMELARFQKQYPEIRFYARRDHPKRIAFALWDQAAFRQLHIGRYTPSMQLTRIAWNLTRRFSGAAEFPSSGRPWKQADFCFANPALLGGCDLDSFIRNEAWDMGCHLVNRIYHGLHQPLITPSGLHHSSTACLFMFGLDGRKPLQNENEDPAYVDLALI